MFVGTIHVLTKTLILNPFRSSLMMRKEGGLNENFFLCGYCTVCTVHVVTEVYDLT